MKLSDRFKLLLFPVFIVLLDLIFRWDRMSYFHSKHVYFYIGSVITSILFHSLWLLVLKRIATSNWLYYTLGSIYFLLTFFVVGASLAFKNINDLFPNYYTLLYFKTEPKSAFMIIRDVAGWKELLGILGTVALVTWGARRLIVRHIPTVDTSRILSVATIPILLFEGLVAIHKRYDQCALVDVNFFACIQRHAFTWDDHSSFKGKGLGIRKVAIQIDQQKTAKFNVLVIVCESLRKRSLGVYGNSKNTTPKLREFIADHPASSYLFENPFTVSTTTMLAVPATLSGIGPYQDSSLLYTQPLIWDYAKQYDYKRFFLSSHTLEWYRFADFYKHDSLDIWWNHDNSGLPYFNDLGIKDELTINKAIKTIGSFKNKPFTGVIQLNTTHYPYRVPTEYERGEGHYQDSYNNAVRYQDAILGKLFDYLQRTHKLKNTIILLTSDHGESLMEHHNIGHVESNYYETIAIPLFAFIPPSLLTEVQRVALRKNQKHLTSNIDLVPTLIDLWRIDQQNEWKPFAERLTGYSLLKEIPKDRNVISLNNNQIASFNTGLSVVNSRFHFLLRTNLTPAKIEWYRSDDVKEIHDLGPNLPKTVKQTVNNAIRPYPVCSPFFDYLNSNSSNEMVR
ncbi:MAG: sulfatase-like hydrolase/transferase [Flavobacteriales bacterium]